MHESHESVVCCVPMSDNKYVASRAQILIFWMEAYVKTIGVCSLKWDMRIVWQDFPVSTRTVIYLYILVNKTIFRALGAE